MLTLTRATGQGASIKTPAGVIRFEVAELRANTVRIKLFVPRAWPIARDELGAFELNATRPLLDCPRCGKDHEAIEATELVDKTRSAQTHWGFCPTTLEPVLF